MAIEQSTLEQLTERVRTSFRAYIPSSDSWLFPNNLWVTATVIGGLLWEAFGTVRKMPAVVMPDTATGDYLERWAAVYGLQRTLAAYAKGDVTVTGDVDTVIPVDTLFLTTSGKRYSSTTAATITSDGFVSVAVISAEADDAYNLIASTPLTLGSTLAGVTAATVGADGITGGLCREEDADLRERLMIRMRSRQRYGTLCDFRDWALEVVGVKRAWASRGNGYVRVLVELDGATIQQVFDYLAAECRKPVCTTLQVAEVIPQTLSVTISCEDGSTATQRATILQAINDYVLDNAFPGLAFTAKELSKALCAVDMRVTVLGDTYKTISTNHVFTGAVVTYA